MLYLFAKKIGSENIKYLLLLEVKMFLFEYKTTCVISNFIQVSNEKRTQLCYGTFS